MNNKKPGKNDIAWETLFQRYSILEIIDQQGYFEIEATKINEERESRLMAEFDHSVNLENITIITHRLQAFGRIGGIVKNFSRELRVITEYN